jgi:hypothetical protein
MPKRALATPAPRTSAYLDHLVGRPRSARADQDGDPLAGVEHLGGAQQVLFEG